MKKKLIIALAAALVLCCAGVGAWAASNAGTQSDPLVAMSYLEQVQQHLYLVADNNTILSGAGEALIRGSYSVG